MPDNEPTPAPEPTPEPAPTMFGEDGNFTENWTQCLTDEALRDNPTLKNAKSVDALADMTVRAQKMVGADKIALLTEASSEAEIEAWHKAGGRPETAADYGFARPEALPEEYYNTEAATATQDLMHKLGLSKKQADALFEFNNNLVIAELTKRGQDKELEATTLKDKLYSDWGNAFEQKKHLGNVAMDAAVLGDAEFQERLAGKFGSDPDFIRAMSNLGAKFSEASPVNVEMIPTPDDIQTQIDNEVASKAYSPDFAKHGFTKEQHRISVKKVSQLFQQKAKVTKTG